MRFLEVSSRNVTQWQALKMYLLASVGHAGHSLIHLESKRQRMHSGSFALSPDFIPCLKIVASCLLLSTVFGKASCRRHLDPRWINTLNTLEY